jgi:hypothetical protein
MILCDRCRLSEGDSTTYRIRDHFLYSIPMWIHVGVNEDPYQPSRGRGDRMSRLASSASK